jgi:hypothetical protein
MKLLAYHALIIAVAAFSRADDRPARLFPNKEALFASAKAAFAGGSVQELEVEKKKVAVLYCYASGAFSSDAAIYLEEKGAWRLVAYYAPVLNDSIEAFVDGRTVVLKAHQKKQILLTVSVVPEK